MVLKEREQTKAERQAEDLLRQREILLHHDRRRAELEARVKGYEARYGIKSRSIHAAIDRGQLKETQEVCRWIMDYDLLKRSKSR